MSLISPYEIEVYRKNTQAQCTLFHEITANIRYCSGQNKSYDSSLISPALPRSSFAVPCKLSCLVFSGH